MTDTFNLDAIERTAREVVALQAQAKESGRCPPYIDAPPTVVLAMCARLRWAERLEAAVDEYLYNWGANEEHNALRAVLARKPL